jgi:hypothetical protein
MAADGQNPGGLRAWINDHRRMQVKNWALGGQTTWEVEVVEAGDYGVNVLFHHSVKSPLKVAVTAGTARCEGFPSTSRIVNNTGSNSTATVRSEFWPNRTSGQPSLP